MRVLRRFVPRRRRRRGRLALLVVAVIVAGLSLTRCAPGFDLEELTAEYGPAVPVTDEAASSFFGKVATAARRGVETHQVSITITEREATSALALSAQVAEVLQELQTMPPEELQNTDPAELKRRVLERGAPDPERSAWARVGHALNPRVGLRDAQVRFLADGRVVVAGYVHAWRWRQPALMIVAPRAQRGSLELDFVEGRIGRLPAPEWLFDRTAGLLSSMILLGRNYAEISQLEVRRGTLTFVGAISG